MNATFTTYIGPGEFLSDNHYKTEIKCAKKGIAKKESENRNS